MKSTKGQGMIGEVMIGVTAIVVAITIFLILEGTNRGVQEEKISEEVDISIGEINKNTLVSRFLNGNISDPTLVNHDYNMRASRLITYYFSTPGDTVYINGKSIPRKEVKNDIERYLSHKAQVTFGSEVEYYINIQNFNNVEDRPKKINVNNTEKTGDAEVRSAMYLANGEKIYLNLFTNGVRGLFNGF